MKFKYLLKKLADLNPKVFIARDDVNDPDFGNVLYSSVPGECLKLPRELYFDKTKRVIRSKIRSKKNCIEVRDLYEYSDISAMQLAFRLSSLNPNISNICYDLGGYDILADCDVKSLVLPLGFYVTDEGNISNIDTIYKYRNNLLNKVIDFKSAYNYVNQKRHQ